jgi:hypothetical protein
MEALRGNPSEQESVETEESFPSSYPASNCAGLHALERKTLITGSLRWSRGRTSLSRRRRIGLAHSSSARIDALHFEEDGIFILDFLHHALLVIGHYFVSTHPANAQRAFIRRRVIQV